jgi:uncharacterized protein YndB with AHSA1/START domain
MRGIREVHGLTLSWFDVGIFLLFRLKNGLKSPRICHSFTRRVIERLGMFGLSKTAVNLIQKKMETTAKTVITIAAMVHAPVEKVWNLWNGPEHIVKWAAASDDWHTTKSENDLREGGAFSSRMEAKDGSFGFDFGGIYDVIKPYELITYTLGDSRKVEIIFEQEDDATKITQHFEAEGTNPVEMQRGGWQAILNNFKKYAEAAG